MVNTVTENRNRTVAEVRNAFNRNGGNMGENGCVDWLFEGKGIIEVELKGSAQDLAEELEEKKFPGFNIEVDEITANSVTASVK